MIADYIKRLRKAADVLEELLLTGNPFDHPKAARAISARVAKNLTTPPLHKKKGRSYNGTHWKQRLQADATLNGNVNKVAPPPTRVYKPGQHWTQKPENRAKIAKQMRKATKASRAKRAKAATL